MKQLSKYIFFISLWAVFYCPFSYSDNEFNMKNINYFIENGDVIKVSLNIENVNSANSFYRRELENIKLNLYRNDKIITTLNFEKGHWLPEQSKFFLISSKKQTNKCFKNVRRMTINLDSHYINTLEGHYLNLNTGKNLNISCLN